MRLTHARGRCCGSRWLVLGLVLLLPVLQGCFVAGIRPRPGEILREGEFRFGGTCNVATVATGTVKLADGRQQYGYSGFRSMIHPIAWMGFYMYNSTLDFGYAPTSWLELDWSAGYQELGMDLRTPLLSQRSGDPVSLAASAGVWYRPFMDYTQAWYRAGADFSVDLSTTWRWVVNLQASWGPESQSMLPEERFKNDCGSFGQEGCGEYSPAPTFDMLRNELRTTASLGFEVLIPPSCYNGGPWPCEDGYSGTPLYLTFAASPYWVAYAASPDLECTGCSYNTLTGFSSNWGLSLLVSLAGSFGGI